MADLTTVVALLTTTLGAIFAVVTIAAARLICVSWTPTSFDATYVAGLPALGSTSCTATVAATTTAIATATTPTTIASVTSLRARSSNMTDLAAWLCVNDCSDHLRKFITHTCSTLVHLLHLRRCSLLRCRFPSYRRHPLHYSADRRTGRSHGLDGLRRRTYSKSLAWEHLGIHG